MKITTYNKFNSILFISIVLSLQTSSVQSQNFRLFNLNKETTFTKIDSALYENYFLFSKVDSTSFDGFDSIYYFNVLLDTNSSQFCYSDTTDFGSKMLLKNDSEGTHVFFNHANDSIFIRTKLSLAEQWHLYTFPDSSYVRGYVVNQLYAGILPDIFDSIYRIQLNVYSKTGVLQTNVFPNATKMDISQNYGIVEFWPLHNFPNDTIALILRGITNPDTNFVDIKAINCFDFLQGHEFHYIENEVNGTEEINRRLKYFVLHRTDFTDHIEYEMLRTEWKEIITGSTIDTNRIIDTIMVSHYFSDYGFLDTIELKIFEQINFGFSDWVQDDSIYKGIPYKNVFDFYNLEDNCLTNDTEKEFPKQTYGLGLGTIYYFDSISENNFFESELVYFQKGLIEWGTPLNFDSLGFTGVNDVYESHEISIYPNPTSEELNIHFMNNMQKDYTFYIYNAYGQLIKTTTSSMHHEPLLKVDCSDLLPGNYFISIVNEQSIHTINFIKL